MSLICIRLQDSPWEPGNPIYLTILKSRFKTSGKEGTRDKPRQVTPAGKGQDDGGLQRNFYFFSMDNVA